MTVYRSCRDQSRYIARARRPRRPITVTVSQVEGAPRDFARKPGEATGDGLVAKPLGDTFVTQRNINDPQVPTTLKPS